MIRSFLLRSGPITRRLIFITAIVLILGSSLSACSPLYVMRAAYEEGKILWRREPIADVIGRADVKPDTQEKLKLVLSVREFARDRVKLNVGGSYSSFSYVDRPDLTYIVLAAPKTELRPHTWWFLIVGNVPYKGFFSKEEAQQEIAKLEAEGYDTNLRTSAAFSTLGWFDDPLLSHLLRFDKIALAEVVFHELFHNTLFLKGQGAFNESSANFVGHRAVIEFFRAEYGEASTEYRRAVEAWEEEREFGQFVDGIVQNLTTLYQSNIPREEKLRLREMVFTRSKAEWARRVADRPQNRFRRFSDQPLNNAVLMHYVVYLKDLPMFESVYQSQGRDLARTVEALRKATENGGEPFQAVYAWLEKRESVSSFSRNINHQQVLHQLPSP